MNWLDTQTKEILQRVPGQKLAPAKVPEFALVMLKKGRDEERLVRAICRINECSESDAREFARKPTPVTINPDLSEEDALFGQFELVCCDAVSVFVRSEVLEQGDKRYLQSLFEQVLHSSEFAPAKVEVLDVPATESGQKFVDQFLGVLPQSQGFQSTKLSASVPFKKARIMKHWATRVGARVVCESVQNT
jgi:hypothetical protein